MPLFRKSAPTPPPAPAAVPPTPETSDFNPVVNGPSFVELFDASGVNRVFVPSNEVEGWLERGFKKTPVDPKEAIDSLVPLGRAVADAYNIWFSEVQSSSSINHSTATRIACHEAVNQFAQAIANIEKAMPVVYARVEEAAPVPMVDPEGNRHNIDPSQVDMYTAQGFKHA